MPTLLERLARKQRKSQTTNHARYAELVRDVATGKTGSAGDAEALDVLEAVGKSLDDLQDDADEYVRRQKLVDRINGAEQAKSDAATLKAKMDAIEAELQELVTPRHQALSELRRKRHMAEARTRDATGALRDLNRSAERFAWLDEALNVARQELSDAIAHEQQAAEYVKKRERHAGHLQQQIRDAKQIMPVGTDYTAQQFREKRLAAIKQYEKSIAEIRDEIAERERCTLKPARDKAAELRQRLDRLEAKRLDVWPTPD